jgi:hypothetical protein
MPTDRKRVNIDRTFLGALCRSQVPGFVGGVRGSTPKDERSSRSSLIIFLEAFYRAIYTREPLIDAP